jgi:acyl-lipid omega-6 desaturase (Delta-12 desaturase)
LVDIGSFGGRVRSMRSGKELILATKPYAVDYPLKSWWYVVSTTLFLAIAIFGTLWNFELAGRIVCSVLAGFLILRLFVIYHDQQHQAILPKSREIFRSCQTSKKTSLNPIEVFRCLRLKVWDVQSQRMISLGALRKG